jgi:murein DD-endopeptidase MepM/ murein hydrolase activator NlpD
LSIHAEIVYQNDKINGMVNPVLQRPVDQKFPIGQDFGEVRDDTTQFYSLFDGKHPGIDFYLPEGNKVKSSYDGVVVRLEWHDGMGNVIGIRNGNILSLYAHLTEFKVRIGEVVTVGKLIGISGNTGKATHDDKPHLHFELRDLSKTELKDMVFCPQFDIAVSNWTDEFRYVVNNNNSQKTWELLGERYLGDSNKGKRIQKRNPAVSRLDDSEIIIIPNLDYEG